MKQPYTAQILGNGIDLSLLIDDAQSLELFSTVLEIVRRKQQRKSERAKSILWLQKKPVLFNPETHYLKNGKPVKRPKSRI